MGRIFKPTMFVMAGLGALALFSNTGFSAQLPNPTEEIVQNQLAHMGAEKGKRHDDRWRAANPHMRSGGCRSGPDQMGPGMMGPGMMGPGMMGPGMMGPGMMERGSEMGHGMMGQGYGMVSPMRRHGLIGPGMRVLPQKHLTTDDVRHFLEHRLAWHGNKRLKISEVKQADDDSIMADIVTVDDSLVRRLKVDPHTGRIQAVD